jgi:hypothetical protein
MPADGTGRAEETTAALLRKRLAAALPFTEIVMDRLTEAMEGVRRELLPVSGKPLGDLLSSASAELTVLDTIKVRGKKLAAAAGASESERDTGLTIYFAAIASALVYHGQKISSHSSETLERSFAMLSEMQWMTPELVELFHKARQVCGEKLE